jgi:hypothetical protein
MYADPDSAVPSDIHGDKCVHAAVTKSDRTMHAAGGMGSTANDLARWMRLNLSGGIIDGVRIVSEESIKAMQTMQAKAPEIKKRAAGRTREGYGFGWNIGAFRGRKTLDHGGGYVGTSAQITLLPDQKIGIAVLCNASGDLPEMVATEVAARLLGETIEDPLPRLAKQVKQRRERLKDETAEHDENPLDAKTLTLGSPAPYAGRYENADLGTIVIEVQDGRLKGTMGDLPLKFRSTGNDYFRTDTGSSQDLNGRFLSDDQKVVVGISMDVPEAGEVLFKRQAQ